MACGCIHWKSRFKAKIISFSGLVRLQPMPRIKERISIMDIRTQFNKLNTSQKAWAETYQKLYNDSVSAMKREKLTMKTSLLPIHSDKNRYNNVSPYDQNRVLLEKKNSVNTDYINASPVTVSRAFRNYILSQGPVPDSLTDFWQMIFEKNVPCIVMLNRLYEGRSLKCEMYYPNKDKKEVRFQNYTITLLSEEEKECYTVRKLKADDEEKTIELYQIQYTEWPDFGVPESTAAFLDMLNYIKELNVLSTKESDPPTVVHCSAGIGRSGTFILVDTVLRMIELGVPQSEISVHDILIDMRCQRFGLVQTDQQLRFAWQAIVDGSSDKSKETVAPVVEPIAQDVCKKRRSESQEDSEDRLSKRREVISQMVAKSRAAEAKLQSTGSLVQAVFMGGAVAVSAVLAYYFYNKK